MNTIRILIIEDDLETLSVLLKMLANTGIDFSPVVVSQYTDVIQLINPSDQVFNVILLDHDCQLGGSFHVFDLDKFGVDKVIAISTVLMYNEKVRQRGVSECITKDYENLDQFADAVLSSIKTVLHKQSEKE